MCYSPGILSDVSDCDVHLGGSRLIQSSISTYNMYHNEILIIDIGFIPGTIYTLIERVYLSNEK